ncbi:MAG: shikimate dehydrogenase [Spirochaetes bacterium]|nr:shikimate dehydrogenase [Spirochaetota bacterium]
MKLISANTKLVGLIGMPLGQTFSPRLHNEAYLGLGLDYFYFPIELADFSALPKLLAGLRLMNFGGMAVTKPYKVEILKHLDDIDENAKMIGSVNTIQIIAGKWKGYNTDGIGAVTSLRQEIGELAGRKYLSFGSGGCARAVCFELAKAGAAKIVLTDIHEGSHELSGEINRFFPGLAKGIIAGNPAGDAAIEAAVKDSDVLINNSGLGMQPHLDETPLPKNWIQSRHICFDAIYNPLQTRFLADAAAQGCQTINGLDMCKYQGTAQVELWTGRTGSEKFMHETLAAIMKEKGA